MSLQKWKFPLIFHGKNSFRVYLTPTHKINKVLTKKELLIAAQSKTIKLVLYKPSKVKISEQIILIKIKFYFMSVKKCINILVSNIAIVN